jgi:hypothetical protein
MKNIVADKTCECLDGVLNPAHVNVIHPVTKEKYAISQLCFDSLLLGRLPQDCKLYGVNFNAVVPNAQERLLRGDTTLNEFGQPFASAEEANAASE